MIASTPAPPYYAVIFTNSLSESQSGYEQMADKMQDLAEKQPGYLGNESVRNGLGITVSYWKNLESIKKWKEQADHQLAQKMGREKFYSSYKTRICLVERDYSFEAGEV